MRTVTNSLNRVKSRVEHILEDVYEARDDDRLLYFLVCKQICEEQNVDVDRLSFESVMLNRDIKLPNYESVRRSRAKIQEDNKKLWGNRKAEREELQEDWIASELV